MMSLIRRRFDWVVYVLWALFLNACNAWLIIPLAQDYAILGIVIVFAIVVLWLTSVPKHSRRKWVAFSVFSLLLGNGLSSIAFFPGHKLLEDGLLMFIGLLLVIWWFGRVRISNLILGGLALVVANTVLPFDEWPFLTHFYMTHYGKEHLLPSDLNALPFTTIQTSSGTSVVTLDNLTETKKTVQEATAAAGAYPDELKNVLRSFKHRYKFVEFSIQDGAFVQKPVPPEDLAKVDPNQLISSFFPLSRAYWTVQDGQVIQFMAPTESPRDMTQIVNAPAYFPTNMLAMAQDTEIQEMADWKKLLSSLGVTAQRDALEIRGGRLIGDYQGRNIDVPVRATEVVGAGSFTASHVHEVLLEGANELQVISLDSGKGVVVSSYAGPTNAPLPNDVKVGPIDNSGEDAIFVNDSPAYILRVTGDSSWKTLYRATSATFRFEDSIRFTQDRAPEIITDDPSFIRNSPVRYFSSYTYRNGQLVRNWRVFRTNVVNVTPVQFTPNGPEYIVAAIYSTGEFIILKRHFIPVVPITSALLGLVIVAGWGIRLRRRGGTNNA